MPIAGADRTHRQPSREHDLPGIAAVRAKRCGSSRTIAAELAKCGHGGRPGAGKAPHPQGR